MAHVQFRENPDGLTNTLIVNGLDLSMETYADSVEVITTGPTEFDEVALRLTIAIGRLDLDDDLDVSLPGNVAEVARRVAAMQVREVDSADAC